MKDKPRKPWVAGLLAFLTIGLGHIYSGEIKKGLILYLGQGLVLAVILLLLVIKPIALVLFLVFSIGLTYFLFNLFDAVKIAKNKSALYSLRKFNKWYIYLVCWFLTGFVIQPLVVTLIKENIIKAYKIPSGAMIPNLLSGDHILVNRYIYKTKKPQRGDIIVFEYPKDPTKDFVKRLVGVEGDIVEIINKNLYVNNIKQAESFVVHSDARTFPVSEQPRDNFGPITVPLDSLFFMGDNRDNSYDSRFWGVVSKEKIRGKVMSIYWSWDKESGKVRWERVGKNVEKQQNETTSDT